MNQLKHICDLSWCKIHSRCIYHNAEFSLKSDAYEIALTNKVNSDIILCYQKREQKLEIKENQTGREIKEKLIEIKLNEPHCQNPKCNSVADAKFNGAINLCYKCLDTLREWKTNYELGIHFKTKDKILKLFKLIDELNPPKKEMVRCSNIYCGTLSNITRHHLIPKPYRRGLVTPTDKIPLCEDCHKKVHRLKTNKELAKNYNTKESIVELLANDVPFRVRRVLNVYENVMVA